MQKYFSAPTIVSAFVALVLFSLVLWLIAKNTNWMAPATSTGDSTGSSTDATGTNG